MHICTLKRSYLWILQHSMQEDQKLTSNVCHGTLKCFCLHSPYFFVSKLCDWVDDGKLKTQQQHHIVRMCHMPCFLDWTWSRKAFDVQKPNFETTK
jgi:hypothetical protein